VFTNGGNSGGGGGQPAPAQPPAPTLSWSGGALQVAWTAVENATGYTVSYQTDGPWTSTDQTEATNLSLAVPPGPLYTVCITASDPGGVTGPGPTSTFQSIGAPTNLTASFIDPSIQASWNAVAGAEPGGYAVTLMQGGQPVSPPPAEAFAGTSCTITADVLQGGGNFTVSVAAASQEMTGPPSSVDISIGVLPAPGGLVLSSGPSTVLAQWTAVPGATGYRARALDVSGNVLSPQPAVQVNAADCIAVLSGGTLASGQVIQVEVEATAAGSAVSACCTTFRARPWPSPWSRSRRRPATRWRCWTQRGSRSRPRCSSRCLRS
jgi:hypothetical protein